MQTPKGIIDDSIIALLGDEEILAKMSEAKSPEECYDIVKDRVAVSFEEFVEMMAIGKSYLDESQEGLLSEEDLDAVAGGKMSTGEIVIGAVGGTLAVIGIGVMSAAGAMV